MEIIYFYGDKCDLCRQMEPVIDEFEKEFGKTVLRINTDEGTDAIDLFKELAEGNCEGVPYVVNQENGKFVCGLTDLKNLKEIL